MIAMPKLGMFHFNFSYAFDLVDLNHAYTRSRLSLTQIITEQIKINKSASMM